MSDVHFRHSFNNAVYSIVPDTLIDLFPNINTSYSRWPSECSCPTLVRLPVNLSTQS